MEIGHIRCMINDAMATGAKIQDIYCDLQNRRNLLPEGDENDFLEKVLLKMQDYFSFIVESECEEKDAEN